VVDQFIRIGLATVASSLPLLVCTDATAGPTTGGEDNKGCYLGLYGLNLGSFSDYGVIGTRHVTVGGVEVDNYRVLADCVEDVTARLGIRRIVCQVGALGSPEAGVALRVDIVDNSSASIVSNQESGGFLLNPDGEAMTFTPQPGNFIFVATAAGGGSDANPGTFAAPKLQIQNSSADSTGAVVIGLTANSEAGTPPGTWIVVMPGTHEFSGRVGRGVDLFRVTGRPATGAANRGPFVFYGYPGAPGSNVPGVTNLDAPVAGGGGAFNGNDTARATEVSTAWGGFTGWCQDIHLFNFNRLKSAAATGGDAGPINTQNKGQRWRVVNCAMTWPSTVLGGSHGRSAGIEGSPWNGRFYCFSCYDIFGDPASNENHGIYIDGGGAAVATGNIFAYFTINNITAGNGVQSYDGVNGAGMDGNVFHHFYVNGTNKHALNIADNTRGLLAHNFILQHAGEGGIRISTSAVVAANAIYCYNFVVYGWGEAVANRYGIADEASLGGSSASARIENGVFMQTPAHASNGYATAYLNSGKLALANNRWYDPNGVFTTKPAADTQGSYGDPGFTDEENDDFSLAVDSACLNVGNVPLLPRAYDYLLQPAPVGVAHDIGVIERQT